jgi:hypothetical protein
VFSITPPKQRKALNPPEYQAQDTPEKEEAGSKIVTFLVTSERFAHLNVNATFVRCLGPWLNPSRKNYIEDSTTLLNILYEPPSLLYRGQIHSPLLGKIKVDSGIGLLYRPGKLHELTGRGTTTLCQDRVSPNKGLRIWPL